VTPSVRTRRLVALAAIAAGLMLLGTIGVAAVSLTIGHSNETFAGQEDPTTFLTHWQETGALPGTTPLPAPALLSVAAGAPTLLPTASGGYLIAAGTPGDEAAEWTFSETVGVAASDELVLAFTVEATVGGTTATHSFTVYVETQAVALPGTLTFTLYWDGGATTGVTLDTQYEVSQACSAVGVCP
jgi:hypothetical protein